MRIKMANDIWVSSWNFSSHLTEPVQGPLGVPRPHFENLALGNKKLLKNFEAEKYQHYPTEHVSETLYQC